MSVHAGTVVTGRPPASWWKNSGCSRTSALSGEVWLKTTSIITLSPAACAAATSVVEVGLRAQLGVDRAVVADRVRAAQGALAADLPDRVDGHQVEDVDPERGDPREVGGDVGQAPVRPVVAREHLVDHQGAHIQGGVEGHGPDCGCYPPLTPISAAERSWPIGQLAGVEPAVGQGHATLPGGAPARTGRDDARVRLVGIDPREQVVELRERGHRAQRCPDRLGDPEPLEVPGDVLADVAAALALVVVHLAEQHRMPAQDGQDLARGRLRAAARRRRTPPRAGRTARAARGSRARPRRRRSRSARPCAARPRRSRCRRCPGPGRRAARAPRPGARSPTSRPGRRTSARRCARAARPTPRPPAAAARPASR